MQSDSSSVQFDEGLWTRGTHIALGVGGRETTGDQQSLARVGLLGEVGLEREELSEVALILLHDSLTVLHLCSSPARTLRASITMRPAMTALVVAIAGTMLPAIAVGGGKIREEEVEEEEDSHLMSNLDVLLMLKENALMLAAATTKSRWSALS